VIRPVTISAAAERIRAFEEGEKPSKAEIKALYLLAAAGRLSAPKKTSLGTAADFAAARRAQEDEAEDQAKRDMRAAVFDWNIAHTGGPGVRFGRCDCGCGYVFRHAEEGECDHWIERSQGGEHTRENGWRLRTECHHEKTNERPPLDIGPGAALQSSARGIWNLRRQDYCKRAGIPFVPRREK
jgi:hypothetical protein